MGDCVLATPPQSCGSTQGHRRLNGIGRMLDQNGTKSNIADIALRPWREKLNAFARSAATPFLELRERGFARINANQRRAVESGLILKSENAPSVARSSGQTSSSLRPHARFCAGIRLLRVLAVESLSQREDVYCLTVPRAGCFLLANGAVVSNCGDELRYACMSRPWTRTAPVVEPIRGANEMTMAEAWELLQPKRSGRPQRI